MTPPTEDHGAARRRMADEIAQQLRETVAETGIAALDPRVMAALRGVARECFVPPAQAAEACANRPLDIGRGQTISQPFIVALMTQLLDLQPGDRVLEVGTGSGYQAAVLCALAGEVYSIEIVRPLARAAARALRAAGCRNLHTRSADGHGGWPEAAPFDAIIVTAAAREVPQPLLDQLAPGGRLVIPLGTPGAMQTLYRYEKGAREDGLGAVSRRRVLDVRFVPFTRAG
jgi:protein-L-isoaspartate(D-aspartate) O-methyltransferase